MMSLAENIKYYRNKKKLLQKELADQCGISISAIEKLEQGILTNPTLDILIKLSKGLDTKLDNLVTKNTNK